MSLWPCGCCQNFLRWTVSPDGFRIGSPSSWTVTPSPAQTISIFSSTAASTHFLQSFCWGALFSNTPKAASIEKETEPIFRSCQSLCRLFLDFLSTASPCRKSSSFPSTRTLPFCKQFCILSSLKIFSQPQVQSALFWLSSPRLPGAGRLQCWNPCEWFWDKYFPWGVF